MEVFKMFIFGVEYGNFKLSCSLLLFIKVVVVVVVGERVKFYMCERMIIVIVGYKIYIICIVFEGGIR